MNKAREPFSLLEMARLGVSEDLTFSVYTEPLGKKSFHVGHKADFEIVVEYPSLDVLEIKHNKKPKKYAFLKGDQPPSLILGIIEKFLDDKSKIFPKLTNRESFEGTWVQLNENIK